MARSAIMSVRITGNSDDAVKAFSKVTGKAAAFGSFMGGMAVKGVTALWDKLKGFSAAVVDMSDSTDKFKQTMGFAGLDTTAIDQATKATRDYADRTVYDLTTVQNTTAQLAANGVPNYDKLAEAAGNLNAVAGGNSETFKSVAMMLIQTAGAGKLTTENWNQLADAIPGASGKLQEAMLKNGAYTGNFRDALANGEITSQEFNDALMQLGMNDGAIKAAESTQTFEGAFGNLEATIVDGAANIVNTVKPYITGAVTALGDGIGKAMQWVNDFTGALMKSQGVQTFANGVKSIAGAVGSIVGPFAGVIGSLLGFTGGAASAGGAAQRFSDILALIGGVLQSVGTFVQQNTAWLTPLAAAIMGAYTAFVLWNGAITLWQTATKIATGVQAAFNAVMNANPIMLAVTAIAALVAGLVWFFTQTETGRQLWADFTGFLQATWQNITDFFQTTWQNITQWFSNAAANIQNGWNALTAFIGSIPGRIQAFFASIGQWFANKFNEVRNGIANGFNSAVSFVASIPGRILSALGNLGRLLWNAGASIMQGFLDGLKSIWHNITSFVGNIAGWIADHKGPLPYDRRLLIPAGEAIMGGFRKSLNAGWQQVQADIMGMNVGLSNGFKTPAYVYGGSGMDYTPNTGSASNVHITNYYPQADPWPLSTNDSLDKMTVGI